MCLFLVKHDYLPFMLKRLMVGYYTSITSYYYGTHSNFVFIHYSCNTLGHVRCKILIYQSDKFCEAVSVNGKPIYVVLRMVLCGLVCALNYGLILNFRCLIEHLAHIVLLSCSTNKWWERSTGTYTLLSGYITRGLQTGYRAFML